MPASPVPKEIIDKAIKYIQKCTMEDGAVQYSFKGGGPRPAITAAAVACLFNAGDYDDKCVPTHDDLFADSNLQQHCRARISATGTTPIITTPKCMYREGGEKWEKYRDQIYARLVSEATEDRNGIYWKQGYVGDIYTTAVNLTILQLDNEHPADLSALNARCLMPRCRSAWCSTRSTRRHVTTRLSVTTCHSEPAA